MRLLLIILSFPLIIYSDNRILEDKIKSDVIEEIRLFCANKNIGHIKYKNELSGINDFWKVLFEDINENLSGLDTFVVVTKNIEGEIRKSGTETGNESYDLYYHLTVELKRPDFTILNFMKTGMISGVQKDNDNKFLNEITSTRIKEESWQYSLEPYIVISAVAAILFLFLNAKL